MKIEAVIFDMDGLMLDTEDLTAHLIKNTLEEYGYKFPDFIEWFYQNGVGVGRVNIIVKLKEMLKVDVDFDSFWERFSVCRRAYIKEHGVEAKPGLFELLDYCKANNLKMAIASSSALSSIKTKCEGAGLPLSYFSSIISSDHVSENKPNPQVYHAACISLGVSPDKALALEDSDAGVESAYRAGLKVILIPDKKKNSPQAVKMAYRTVKTLKDVIPILK